MKISGSYWQYYEDEAALNKNGRIIDFPNDNNISISFKSNQQKNRTKGNNWKKFVGVMDPLKYLTDLWRTVKMPLINYDLGLTLVLLNNYLLGAGTAATQEPIFTITETKFYVSVVTLSTNNNVKILKQLEIRLY